MKNMVFGTVPTLDYATREAVNTLATNITFAGSQYRSIMMTSCVANEGKSFISFHLVCTLANMGYSTLLIDADLRKSVFFSRYDVRVTGHRSGLTHYLAGHSPVEDVLYQTNIPNVYVIPTGKEVINSLPLLTSSAFLSLLDNMKESFDFVIIDAPPVGLVIDAAMIANACDATVMVVTNEVVSKHELIEAVQQIEKSRCTILGVVLNKVAMETHKSRKYYYKSYYSHYGAKEYGTDSGEEPSGAEPPALTAMDGRQAQAAGGRATAAGRPSMVKGQPGSGANRGGMPGASGGQMGSRTNQGSMPGAASGQPGDRGMRGTIPDAAIARGRGPAAPQAAARTAEAGRAGQGQPLHQRTGA